MSDAVPTSVQPRAVVMTQLRKPKRSEAVFRTIVVLVILGSLALTWWAFTMRFVPTQNRSRELTTAVSRLSSELDVLERKWTKEETAEIRARYTELHTQLFADTAALQAWMSRLEEMAAPLSLQATVEFGNTVPQLTNDYKVAFIPANVSLEVHPVPNSSESPYQRLLRLGQKLAAEGKRADLAEMTVAGGPTSITKAQLVFNLWAGEEPVEPAPATQNGGSK